MTNCYWVWSTFDRLISFTICLSSTLLACLYHKNVDQKPRPLKTDQVLDWRPVSQWRFYILRDVTIDYLNFQINRGSFNRLHLLLSSSEQINNKFTPVSFLAFNSHENGPDSLQALSLSSLIPLSYTRTQWTRRTLSPQHVCVCSISDVTQLFNVQSLSVRTSSAASSVSPFWFFSRSDGEKWTQTVREVPSPPEASNDDSCLKTEPLYDD